MLTQNIFIVLPHYFCVVYRYLVFHVGKCPVSSSDSVTIEEAPELVTRGITFIKGRKHSPDDTARDSVIPGRIKPKLAALPIAGDSGLVKLGHVYLLIFKLVFISGLVQCILIHRSVKFECGLVTVEDI